MEAPFGGYTRKREFLVCVDSDGCAIDSMDIKHIRCFGPCMADEWELTENRQEILDRWNEINLYTMTRGINRFRGLAMMLKEVNETYAPIADLDSLLEWVEEADELSNASVFQAAEARDSICLRKALSWSQAVNRAIGRLPKEDVRPFEGVREMLAAIHGSCDVAVVSSANYEAVEDEWRRYGLLEHVDVVLAQNAGSKKSCIEKLLTFGYEKEHVMMTGDAPGDLEAAQKNGVFFYPILVRQEARSWAEIPEGVRRLQEGAFGGAYQEKLIRTFTENLS